MDKKKLILNKSKLVLDNDKLGKGLDTHDLDRDGDGVACESNI